MTQPTQADIFAALQAQSSDTFKRSQPQIVTSTYESLSESPDLIEQLTRTAEEGGDKGKKVNCRKLYCPRDGCGSLILLDGVGELIEVPEGPVLQDDPSSPFPPSSSSSSAQKYWSIPSSPFSFENIGFSRPDKSTLNPLPAYTPKDVSNMEGKVKYLICAECDLGPLGWSFDGGKGAWLDLRRLRYGERK